MMSKIQNKLLGDAGEYYVAFQLARRGISPALLSTNTKGVDLLATISGRNSISIQVKASAGRNNPRTWAVGKHRPEISKTFFYIFINVWDDYQKIISCYVIPSSIVAESVNWDASMPQFCLGKGAEDLYHENWESILEVLSEIRS